VDRDVVRDDIVDIMTTVTIATSADDRDQARDIDVRRT